MKKQAVYNKDITKILQAILKGNKRQRGTEKKVLKQEISAEVEAAANC